ncbi:hypothetical protein [Viridibacillus arvi]|uniref:hypothetical protein n=1 Tax=Viridibacillus arvi TaxID=263475 RepID=UPI003D2AE847
MLIVNKVKIEIITNNNKMGFEESFDKNLNIICSDNNTSGKSSVISALYYALGLEEIMGGKGYKVLTNAYKNSIQHEKVEHTVLESKVFLEISNGSEIITIFRRGKMLSEDSKLVTIFFSKLSDINNLDTIQEDMYVHFPNSATNKKGFFTFLESFLKLDLPFVPGNQDVERKLYLQLIFSAMFIEQKRGWADLFSGMPHFGIKDQKKRVIEYILDLDTLHNEKLKFTLKSQEKQLIETWKDTYKKYSLKLDPYGFKVNNINDKIELIDKNTIKVSFYENGTYYSIDEYITKLQKELDSIVTVKKNTIDNFIVLESELNAIKEDISNLEKNVKDSGNNLRYEKSSLNKLKDSLSIIHTDIVNNKDAQRLKNLGSKEEFNIFNNICPTCEQNIEDTVLISQNPNKVMSIEENIKHLESQQELFKMAINQKTETISQLESDIKTYNVSIEKLYLLLQVTQNDLYSPAETYSESIVYRKVELQKLLFELGSLKVEIEKIDEDFLPISDAWKENQKALLNLPKDKLSELDQIKLNTLRNYFVSNLKAFGYKSSLNIHQVQISKDTFLPIIENFDMKFDSSASDHIRGIWAFTIALLQASNDKNGNHPGILIFDEPGQHSIILDDMQAFFTTLKKLDPNNQIIIGITVKESDLKKLVLKEINTGAKGILIKDRAFQIID